jgi:hypothetical protein
LQAAEDTSSQIQDKIVYAEKDYFRLSHIKRTMEQRDATATIGLQDVLEVLPEEIHRKIVPATRTFVLRRTSKTMCAAVENAKLDTIVVRKSGVKFRNGAGLQDKFNGLNAWCRVTVLDLRKCDLQECDLQEGGAQAIAAVLRVNTTLTNLDLHYNQLGDGGGQAIASALRVNTTLTNLNLEYNELGEGVKSGVRESWGNRGGELELVPK